VLELALAKYYFLQLFLEEDRRAYWATAKVRIVIIKEYRNPIP
jgi:hypothetical protein